MSGGVTLFIVRIEGDMLGRCSMLQVLILGMKYSVSYSDIFQGRLVCEGLADGLHKHQHIARDMLRCPINYIHSFHGFCLGLQAAATSFAASCL